MSEISTNDLIRFLKTGGEIEDVDTEALVAGARDTIADAREIASCYASSSDRGWPIAYLLKALRHRDQQVTALQGALQLAGESVKTFSEHVEVIARQNVELVSLCEEYRNAAQLAIQAGRQLQMILNGRK